MKISVMSEFTPKEFNFLLSGGVDSVAASHWLSKKFRKINFRVIHFNHGVQFANKEMEESVKDFCENVLGKECVVIQRDDRYNDLTENGLRNFRLDYLRKIGGDFITAHHLDDAVENYLMNCFKGCQEHKPITECTKFENFSIFHPFLKNRKSVFERYLIDNNIERYVVIDPTNKDNRMRRNWIRNRIVPEIEGKIGIHKVVLRKFYRKKNEETT